MQARIWARNGPENFENRAALVAAEIARIEGRDLEAMRLYEDAIRSARANGFLQNEALAYELAARFYAARGFEEFARVYLRRAREGYLRWGAVGKARQLEELHPYLVEQERLATSTAGAPGEHLDFATVIEVSQAVSGEMVLEKLIDTLMRTAIEHAGAERGLLILSRDAEQRIAADATTSGNTVVVHMLDERVSSAVLPESVLHYVMRTQESVILDDASAQNAFSVDPYFGDHDARSVLCLPLSNRGKLIGVLYLENNLVHVFAPRRIAVLKLLASQAAMSLENTRLYHDLAKREAKIRQNERYLAEAQRLTHTGSWAYNCVTGKHTYYSDEAFRLFGLDPRRGRLPEFEEEISPLIHPEERDRILEELAPIFRDKAEYEQDYRIVLPDGTVRHLHSIGHPVLDQAGELVEYFGTVLDVTERRLAEQRLLAAVDELQLRVSMLQQIPGGAWSAKPDGTPDIVNQLWFEYTGQTPEQLNSHPEAWMACVHPDDRERVSRTYWEGIRSGRGFTMEARFLRASDGTYRWHVDRAVAVRDPEGNILRFVGTSTDVHDFRQMQEELRNTQAELAHTTRVLTMGELTASIAHEVNQPLGAIVASAGASQRWLAAKPPQMEKARRALERIVNDGRRAGEVIKRIRALMKRQAPRKDWLQINEAILEVIAIVQHQLRRNDILLETKLAEGLPLVWGDRVQLQQVLLNLIVNAIEAMSGIDERRRELTIVSAADGPEAVVVEVRDSGMGVNPERAANLFEPFYTTKAEGIGIGLSVSRSIVEAHGGQLSAAGNVPHGAVFRFSVPLEEPGSP